MSINIEYKIHICMYVNCTFLLFYKHSHVSMHRENICLHFTAEFRNAGRLYDDDDSIKDSGNRNANAVIASSATSAASVEQQPHSFHALIQADVTSPEDNESTLIEQRQLTSMGQTSTGQGQWFALKYEEHI